MKLSGREAESYFAKPGKDRAGLLIYGADAMRVAIRRQQVLAALLGANADEEMRLTRMQGADLRGDPALLMDAIKAVGFFAGPRAVFVEEAGEAAGPAIAAALADWAPGDAQIIVTAGALKAASKLRKAFEAHPNAYAAGLYDDPPSRAEIGRVLADAGIGEVPPDSMAMLTDLAAALGPGDFARTVEKVAIYKIGDDDPLSLADIAACAPQSSEAALDEVLNAVADLHADRIGPLIRRIEAQGTNAVGLCIGAIRHFRTLYAAASDPGGAAAGAGRLRPPVYGKRRDLIVRQAQNWGPDKLQTALSLLTDTDLKLRSAGQTAPQMALVERALIRLAMLGRSR
ncbi:MAG: DNA polymerase III subunit delta [Rhodobacteraceae bacterium]|nr:DNA polymerase III subunit delta [Paracoccaceae bacterium]